MAELTTLERRSNLLSEGLKKQRDRLTKNLVEPKPYKQVKVREEDQVRKYLQLKETGGLHVLREQMGDASVNDYVRAMQGRAQKYLNKMAEREFIDGREGTLEEVKREAGDPVAAYYTADDDLEHF
jgi:hypothetical protein